MQGYTGAHTSNIIYILNTHRHTHMCVCICVCGMWYGSKKQSYIRSQCADNGVGGRGGEWTHTCVE